MLVDSPVRGDTIPVSYVSKCPGHFDFFHHYSIESKAVRKANIAIQKLLKDDQISTAKYALFDRDTAVGKESGYFDRLNRIYRYAVVLNYTHIDNSERCSHRGC